MAVARGVGSGGVVQGGSRGARNAGIYASTSERAMGNLRTSGAVTPATEHPEPRRLGDLVAQERSRSGLYPTTPRGLAGNARRQKKNNQMDKRARDQAFKKT